MFSIYIYKYICLSTSVTPLQRMHGYNLMIKRQSGVNGFIQDNINNEIDLVALSVEGNVDRSNGEFVFMNGRTWELDDMDGSN